MKCAFCGNQESKVVDSRQTDDGLKIRRRRECLGCASRFTTYEIIETVPLMVVKRDKTRQLFDPSKILVGLLRACEKRPISIEVLEKLVRDIEQTFANTMIREVSSASIGDMIMEKLVALDQVAYVRFASVYKEFADIETFLDELMRLKSKQ